MWNHCQSTWTEWAKAKRELEDKFKSVLIRLFHCNVLRYYYGKWFSFCTLHAMTRTHYSLSHIQLNCYLFFAEFCRNSFLKPNHNWNIEKYSRQSTKSGYSVWCEKFQHKRKWWQANDINDWIRFCAHCTHRNESKDANACTKRELHDCKKTMPIKYFFFTFYVFALAFSSFDTNEPNQWAEKAKKLIFV